MHPNLSYASVNLLMSSFYDGYSQCDPTLCLAAVLQEPRHLQLLADLEETSIFYVIAGKKQYNAPNDHGMCIKVLPSAGRRPPSVWWQSLFLCTEIVLTLALLCA